MTRSTIASSLARRATALAAAIPVVLLLPAAQAAPSPAEVTRAEALFREARKLMADARYAEACPKLAESQRLDPGGGTLLNLGLCHAGQGKTATAWAELREALGQARRDGRAEREEIAEKKLAEIEPGLCRLTVAVAADARTAGLEIKLDDSALGVATWDTALPIDPGSHKLEARAPGRKPFTTTFELKPAHDEVRIAVPALAPDTVAPPPPAGLGGQQVAGIVVGGLGLLSVGIGAGFGVRAIQREQEAEAHCMDKRCTTPSAKQASDDAQAAARVADLTIGIGIAAVGAGVILFITGKRGEPAQKAALIPIAGPSGGGAIWRASW